MNKLFTFLGMLFLMSCHQKDTAIAVDIVAKVYDFTLTRDELKVNLPKANSIVDSLKITEEYIQKWAKQKLLYRNAIVNLDNTAELDELVNKYKEDLYVTHYKNALVNQKLDTLVFDKEIGDFYEENKANFKLNETLLKFRYIHVDRRNRKRYHIKKLLNTDEAEDKVEILSDYSGYKDYYFNDSIWVSLKDVYHKKAEFPMLSKSDLRKTGKIIEKIGADKSIYYVYIKEIATIGDVAPLIYVKPTIKNILLHKNKLKFFNQMEQILIDDAVKQKKYEVY